MKAAVTNSLGGGFATDDVTLANPMGGEVLIDVRASGLCHTDLTLSRTELGFPAPAVFGHEVAGVVTGVGEEVTEFELGDHVVGCLIQQCGRCEKCLGGQPFRCLRPEATLRTDTDPPRISRRGEPVNQIFGLGGFAEQALVHENQLVAIPTEVPFPQAALLGCGVVTGAGAVINTAQVRPGDSVAVIGAGGVGLSAIGAAKLAGASVIVAVDLRQEKLDRAVRFGATAVVNAAATDPVSAVRGLTGGVDHVFDFVGANTPSQQALGMVNVGGCLYMIGISGPSASVAITAFDAITGQKGIRGVAMGSSRPKRDIPMYADLYLQGRLNLDELVTSEIALDEIDAGYESLQDPLTARVVITTF